MSKADKARRKAIRDELKRKERTDAEAKLPLSEPALGQLFDWVDIKLEEEGCDDTLRHTASFLEQYGLPDGKVIAWLKESGGYCDCEVIANVEDSYREIIGGEI